MRLDVIQAVLFDFDFTLGDSSSAIQTCVAFAFEEMGLPVPSEEDILRTIGLSLEEAFCVLTQIPEAERASQSIRAQRFSELFIQRADEVMVDGAHVYEEAVPVMKRLRAVGLKMGIVTTKYRRRIEAVLERDRLTDYFDVIIGGDDVQRPKPSPEGLEKALDVVNIKAEQALFVGDSESDAGAAMAADVAFIGVCTGMTDRANLEKYGPIALLDSVGQLPGFMKRQRWI